MKLSVVMATRNDDRIGSFERSIESFKKLEDAELIVVEWKPPLDRPRLRCYNTRIITVPGEGRFEEYKAKNVGIRRAKGDFILATNPDIVLSLAMIRWLNERPLRADCIYRANRYDLDCKGIVETIHRNTLCDRTYHTNAAGDFILMSRSKWFYHDGFLESDTIEMVDAYLVMRAIDEGMKQVILEEPIYHLPHPANATPHAKFDRENVRCRNGLDWGMRQEKLEETT